MNNIFFFDSYAVIEILKGNPDYQPYTECNILLTKLNLFEVHYNLMRGSSEKEAATFLKKYSKFAVDFDENIIREASRLKLDNRKRNISMADCIGFMVAKRLGIKFLTGDKEFENVPGVEFVK
ncbi:PIN domain-containing protein [Candidatus Woesearchaeota archaeon]|nr:PIN domain-containing protein [Candidatus Woesearchaeota archaeon]